MKKSPDIRELLRDWPYDADNAVRIVPCADGRDVLQVRTPVGIEQYELENRPDGMRPHNTESVFAFYNARLERLKTAGEEDEFRLNHKECVELFEEGVMFYFRYLHLFQLKEWTLTVRDTTRNLRVFDFVHKYAQRKEDRQHLEQWRPYILRMHTIARAMVEAEEHAHDRALRILRDGIEQIEALSEVDNQTFNTERDRAVQALRETITQIEKSRPLSEIEQLEKQLRTAIESQSFERAAQLRDQIRDLRTRPTHTAQ
ncbi:MAG: UvrB/UvrC motif-containing protein [Verrucomicrobiota bacterium]